MGEIVRTAHVGQIGDEPPHVLLGGFDKRLKGPPVPLAADKASAVTASSSLAVAVMGINHSPAGPVSLRPVVVDPAAEQPGSAASNALWRLPSARV